MRARTDELALLRVYARLGAMELSALLIGPKIMGTYSALSTTTFALCAMPKGSSLATLSPVDERPAFLIALIAASFSRVSYLGSGRDEIKFQTLGKADLSSPGNRFAAPSPAIMYQCQRVSPSRNVRKPTDQNPSENPYDMNISYAELVPTNIRSIRKEHLLHSRKPAL